MRFKLAIIAAAALISGSAMAADDGFYVGAGIGASDLAAGGFSGNDFAFKLFAGYDFNKYLGVEGGYWDGGSPSDHGESIDLHGEDLVLIGRWPVADAFDLHVRLGVAWWDARGHGVLTGSDSGSDLLWGFGVGYQFTPHFVISGDWERADIKDTDRADLWTVSAAWKF